MSDNRSRLDRHAAEQLLAGEQAGPLADVLRAAAAPAHPEELAGEGAALAAFRAAAQAEAVPAARKPSAFRSVLGKVLTVKALVVLAVAGTTGVVVAATSGVLPAPWSEPAVEAPPTTSRTPPSTRVPATPSAPGTRSATAGAPEQGPKATRPAPSLAGLCQAYRAQAGRGAGRALENPAFAALVRAAGGREHVDEYCATTTTTEEDRKRDRPAAPPAPATPATPFTDPGAATPSAPPPQRPAPRSGRTKTPVSSARGAATAVPPSGAKPPSQGG
jgi:hypothetical protein